MQKRILISLCLLYLLLPLFATTKLEWGPKLGFNLAQHYGTKDQEQDYEVKTSLRPGINAGVFLDMIILPNLSLGYELLYSMKGSNETITINSMEIDGVTEDLPRPATMKVQYYLDYIELPVLLKVKLADRPAFALTAISGTAMGLKVKGHHKLDGTVYFPDEDGFSIINIKEESKLAGVNMFDFSFVYGGTLELKTKLPLSLDYRFTLGWDYLSLPTYQFFEPVLLRNQTYSLGLSTRF